MLTEQEYIILSFFDKIEPREFKEENLDLEMKLKGIHWGAKGENEVGNIVTRLYSKHLLKETNNATGFKKVTHNPKYIISQLGEREKIGFEQNEQNKILESEQNQLIKILQIQTSSQQTELQELQIKLAKYELPRSKHWYEIEISKIIFSAFVSFGLGYWAGNNNSNPKQQSAPTPMHNIPAKRDTSLKR